MKASLPYKYITSVKNGKYYVIFDFKDKNNNRKRKWVKTDLPAKCSKKALNAKVDELVAEFEQSYYGTCVIKSDSDEDSNTGSVKVTKYMTDWLAAVKPDMAKTTHQGYRAVARGFPHLLKRNIPILHSARSTTRSFRSISISKSARVSRAVRSRSTTSHCTVPMLMRSEWK